MPRLANDDVGTGEEGARDAEGAFTIRASFCTDGCSAAVYDYWNWIEGLDGKKGFRKVNVKHTKDLKVGEYRIIAPAEAKRITEMKPYPGKHVRPAQVRQMREAFESIDAKALKDLVKLLDELSDADSKAMFDDLYGIQHEFGPNHARCFKENITLLILGRQDRKNLSLLLTFPCSLIPGETVHRVFDPKLSQAGAGRDMWEKYEKAKPALQERQIRMNRAERRRQARAAHA